MIDKNTIARLRALHAAVPKGWTAGTGYEQSERGNYIADEDGRIVAAEQDDTDCVLETQARDLMVEMRNALPELLDLAEKMPTKQELQLLELLRSGIVQSLEFGQYAVRRKGRRS